MEFHGKLKELELLILAPKMVKMAFLMVICCIDDVKNVSFWLTEWILVLCQKPSKFKENTYFGLNLEIFNVLARLLGTLRETHFANPKVQPPFFQCVVGVISYKWSNEYVSSQNLSLNSGVTTTPSKKVKEIGSHISVQVLLL